MATERSNDIAVELATRLPEPGPPTRFGVPRRAATYVPMARVRRVLDGGHALTVLNGPDGSGKASQVVGWLHAARPTADVVWIRANECRGEELWSIGLAAMSASQLVRIGSDTDPHTAMRRSLSALSRDLILVVDGVIVDAALVCDIATLLAECHRVRVVVCTSRRGELFESVSDARVLEPEDLGFADEECALVFAAAGVTVSAEVVRTIREETGGRPWLVRAAADAYHPGSEAVDADAGVMAAQRRLRGWLGTIELAPQVAAFLDQICIVEPATAEQFGQLQGGVADGHLVELERLGLGHWVSHEEPRRFALLPVVRSVLCEDLRRGAPDELRKLHARAARWDERYGSPDRGLGHALAARDWELCARIIDRWMPEVSFAGHRPLISRALQAIPDEFLRTYPGAGLMAEFALRLPHGTTRYSLPTSRNRLRALGSDPDAAQTLRRSYHAMLAARRFGSFTQAHALSLRGQHVAGAAVQSRFTSAASIAPFWYVHAGLSSMLAGDLTLARRMFHQSYQHREFDSFGFSAHDAAGKLALVHALDGNHVEAQTWLERARRHPEGTSWVVELVRTASTIAEAIVDTDRLDLATAQELLLHGNGPRDREELWPFTLWARVHRGLLVEDRHMLLELVGDVEAVQSTSLSDSSIAARIVATARAELLLSVGQATRAAAVLAGIDTAWPAADVARARVWLATGHPSSALSVVSECLSRVAGRRIRTELLVLEAAAEGELGDVEAAATALGAAVDLAAPHRDLRAFATVPRRLLRDLRSRVHGVGEILEELDGHRIMEICPVGLDLVELTERESVILGCLQSEWTREDMARELVVSLNTVKSQLRSLFAKLGAHSRDEALRQAYRLGLLGDPNREGETPGEITT